MKRRQKDEITLNKILFSAMILLIYGVGRCIPLIGVNQAAYEAMSINAENILIQTITGDTFRYSVFALGISPYIMSNLIMQIAITVIYGKSNKMSPQKRNRIIATGFLAFTLFQTYQRMGDLIFLDLGDMMIPVKIIAALELITGTMIVIFLAGRNKKYGIGGQTLIILVNIIDGVMTQLITASWKEILLPVGIGLVLMFIMLILENTEKRIPLLRTGVNSVGREKTYQAIKFNPIGIMPIMFSSALYQLIKAVIVEIYEWFPNNEACAYAYSHIALTEWLGIGTYIGCIYFLTYVFSFIMIGPKDLVERLQKSGDCLEGFHPGRESRRYLYRCLTFMDFVSATLMGVTILIPLYLQREGILPSTYVMLPTSLMMLVGIFHNVYEEFRTIKSYSEYYPFI